MQKSEWAQRWAAEGFFVFPCEPNAKVPKVEDWPNRATRDPSVIAEWWTRWPDANIGAHPGASGHAVLDIDEKSGKGGGETLAGLEAENGPLPATLVTCTPSGGRHIWLTLPGSCGNTAGRLGPGVDTRGRRGFVVMPGSEIDGRAYTVAQEGPPADAPTEWSELLTSLSGGPAERREAATTVVDSDAQLFSGRLYLENLVANSDVAVSGSGGNDRTYRVAAALRDMGLTLGAALALAEEHWNPACAPPWDPADLAAIFGHAYAYAQNDLGAKATGDPTGAGFADVEAPAGVPATQACTRRARFVPLTIGEMSALRDPEWLVPGWLPLYETTILYGTRGSMKSFAALDAALSIAAGRAAWGFDYAAKARPVVYVAAEGQIGVAKLRVPAWLLHHEERSDLPFRLIQETPRAASLTADLSEMFAAIEAACPGELPRLVVYDTHARVMAGLDENSAQDTAKALELYDATSRRYSCAVLAIHHSGKNGEAERGSSALSAGVNTVLRMEYENRIAALSCEKMKDAEPPKPIAFTPTKSLNSIVLTRKEWSADDRAPSQLYSDIVAILLRNGAHNVANAMTSAAVASELPCVLACETDAEKLAARRRMEAEMRKRAKELRALHSPDVQGGWSLPMPD